MSGPEQWRDSHATVPLPDSYGGYNSYRAAALPQGSRGGYSQQQAYGPEWVGPDGRLHHVRPYRRGRWLRRLLGTMVTLVVLAGLTFTALMLAAPSVGNAPQLAQAFDQAHHAVYPGPPVASRFAAALTATEDHRFYSEPGIDPFAVGRVAAGRLTGQPDQGGATLYQQLAKMLYTPGRAGFNIELEQVLLGIKLSFSYSKAQILRMYADVAYFGNGYYGLSQASCGYFGKPASRLSWPQSAVLAGLVQAPTAYDPLRHLSVARSRESHVLGRLAATGALTAEQAARAYRSRLHLVGGVPSAACTGA